MTDRIQPITMPKWGMTMTEGKVADWLKSPGERIEKGEDFVEIETEKITNVVEADTSGTLRRVLVPEGRSAPCGALIAVLAEADVDEAEIDGFLGDFAAVEPEDKGAAGGPSASEIEADGIRLRVVTAEGPEEAAPAILLHGFGADAAVWLFNQEVLAANRTVHAVELPSHGGSQVDPDRASVRALTAAVAAAVDALAPDRVHLVGHSLGGLLALKVARSLGDRLGSLTLIAPAGFGAPVDDAFLAQFAAADRRRPMKAALQMLVADPAAITSEMIERTLSYKRIDGVPEALSRIADIAIRTDAPEAGAQQDLAALSAPVLVIWGARDAIVPPPAEAPVGIRRLDAAGHMPQMEAASEVNAMVSAHMQEAE